MPISGVTMSTLAQRLRLPQGAVVTFSGAAEAIGLSNSSLAHFEGDTADQFLVLSTGRAFDVTLPNSAGNQGTDFGATGISGDTAIITITMPKPVNARAFTFDFTFLSEEYPEFVGSQYNDYLSVKVNGVEAAIDLAGNPITVNNNFFTSQYSPTGTMFDGQTPPLRITVPISQSATMVTVTIEIADAGDGIYDSAAFLKSFAFLEKQIVYLEFAQALLEFSSLRGLDSGFTLPGSGFSVSQMDTVVANANTIYKDYLVEFTRTKPTSGDYSIIHVGGVVDDLPFWLEKVDLAGKAESVDIHNRDRSDNAFVLSGRLLTISGAPDIPLISQVVAHEAGHLLGLVHVPGNLELMNPGANASRTVIGSTSAQELQRNLGMVVNSTLIPSESFFDQIKKFFSFSVNSTLPALFDVKVVVATSDGLILSIEDVGDLNSGDSIEVLASAAGSDKIVLIGKSSAAGGYDAFMTPGGLTNFNAAGATDETILSTLGVAVSGIATTARGLVTADAAGNLTDRGTLTTTLVDIAQTSATGGADALTGTTAADVLPGLGGDDVISGLDGNDELYGNEGNDALYGGTGNDRLIGGDGNDVLEGGAGNDDLRGNAGANVAAYASAASAVAVDLALAGAQNTGGGGIDTLHDIQGLVGSAFADTLRGDGGANSLNGGAGLDNLVGGLGDDNYFVDNVGDIVTELAGGGYDSVYASATYVLRAGVVVEVLSAVNWGDAAALNLTGNSFANALYGNAGANLLDGGGGMDVLTGFGGDDSYMVDNAGDLVIEAANGGYDTVYASASYGLRAGVATEVLSTISWAALTAVDLTGNEIANALYGNAGANVLNGGAGADAMYGFQGDDTYFVDNASDAIVEGLGGGFDTVYATAGYSLRAGVQIEILSTANWNGFEAISLGGNEFANALYGNAGANILNGGAGSDAMYGFAGDDTYFVDNASDAIADGVNSGFDTVYATVGYSLNAGAQIEILSTANWGGTEALNLSGNEFANTLYGNAGANRLDGGAGSDRLTGQGGADIFAFTTALGAANIDTIVDFLKGTDRVGLDDAIFTGLALGTLNANAFFAGTAAHDADDRIVYNGTTGALLFDADGTGATAAVQFATLATGLNLAASDFTVI